MPTFFYGNQEGLLNSEPLFSFTILIQVDLHQCDISSAHIATLSSLFSRGLQSLTLGRLTFPTLNESLSLTLFFLCRNCKLVGVKAQLMEELGMGLEEITVESNEITQTQWKGLLLGLAKSTKLRRSRRLGVTGM